MNRVTLLILLMLLNSLAIAQQECHGHVVNPVTDICWSCFFPFTIGKMTVKNSSLPDTKNPDKAIGQCPSSSGLPRFGLNIGFWEPMALVDVTDKPYCLVNAGGRTFPSIKRAPNGSKQTGHALQRGQFYHVHWYHYPILQAVNLMNNGACAETGIPTLIYLSELDPTWYNENHAKLLASINHLVDDTAAIALLSSCAIEAAALLANQLPIDNLFWCAGQLGGLYPLTGYSGALKAPMDAALLLTQRVNQKLHAMKMIEETGIRQSQLCQPERPVITPKSRYRVQLINPIADNQHCYPMGKNSALWIKGHLEFNAPTQLGFLMWRKRNCTAL